MKKIIMIAAVAGLFAVSCKKERTCTCTRTHVSSTTNGVTNPVSTSTYKTETKLDKTTKSGAACNSGDRTSTDTYTSGGTTVVDVDVHKYDCTLD